MPGFGGTAKFCGLANWRTRRFAGTAAALKLKTFLQSPSSSDRSSPSIQCSFELGGLSGFIGHSSDVIRGQGAVTFGQLCLADIIASEPVGLARGRQRSESFARVDLARRSDRFN